MKEFTRDDDVTELYRICINFCRHFCSNPDDVRDIVQAAYEAYFLAGYAADLPMGVKVCLIKKAVYARWVDFYREKYRREYTLTGRESLGEEAEAKIRFCTSAKEMEPFAAAAAQEFRENLEKAVDSMHDAKGIVLRLVLLEGMTIREASEYLNIGEAACRKRYNRGLAVLRKKMERFL
jgi:RNA polymerase sigma factor (sigma-70 family)